jgi:hypothetical protein
LAARTESIIASDRRSIGGDRQSASPSPTEETLPSDPQSAVEATKFNVGQSSSFSSAELATVDEGLPDLPDGYGESCIVLLPRDPQWAYAYWDVPNEHRQAVRQQGGQRLALRIYDVTDMDINAQNPHSVQQYECDELARDWYVPIPVSDRDYLVEIGYVTGDGSWMMLARSATIRVPPVYPSEWADDQFIRLDWDVDLRGKTVFQLNPPTQTGGREVNPLYGQLFDLAQSAEAQRIAGSIFGSMQHVPGSVFGSMHMASGQAISSYVFPSGVGMWALPTVSGLNMSGVGFSASAPPIRPRQFWLVADAELIVYGATEADATVTIAGQPIQLNPDGTFRFQLHFTDGEYSYPIMAVAADGEQNRSIHMEFKRKTLENRTNTKEEAVQEWLSDED